MNALTIAAGVATTTCLHCGVPVVVKVTDEPERGGSLKLEADCRKCFAYAMVRITARERASLVGLMVQKSPEPSKGP